MNGGIISKSVRVPLKSPKPKDSFLTQIGSLFLRKPEAKPASLLGIHPTGFLIH